MCVCFLFFLFCELKALIFSIHFESSRKPILERKRERLTLASLSSVFSSLSRRSLFCASHELVLFTSERKREREETKREERERVCCDTATTMTTIITTATTTTRKTAPFRCLAARSFSSSRSSGASSVASSSSSFGKDDYRRRKKRKTSTIDISTTTTAAIDNATRMRGIPSGSRSIISSSRRTSERRRRRTIVNFGEDVGEQTSSLLDDVVDTCPVPMDQRPSSQLKEVAEGLVSGWGGLDGKSYALRLTILCGFFFTVIAYPIASETYNPEIQWTEAHVAALLGSLVAVSAITLNIHNSWDYVRNRLLSATIEYEETGWYDGQVYVKTPEMLAKDRLDGTYVCGPAVARCKKTMLACGAGVLGCVFALNALDAPKVDQENFGSYTPQKAALLRDLGMGTYIDAGEGKRISQGGMFSRETANKYEPAEEQDEDESDEVNGVVMSYAPSVSIASSSSSSSSSSSEDKVSGANILAEEEF